MLSNSTPVLVKTKRKRDADTPDYSDSEVHPKKWPLDSAPTSTSTASALVSKASAQKRRIHLRIDIPSELPNSGIECSTKATTAETSPSSLFTGSDADVDSLFNEPVGTTMAPLTSQHLSQPPTPASLTAPPIPGLFFTPTLRLPQELADEVMQYCLATYFRPSNVNQVMLFGRASSSSSHFPSTSPSSPNLKTPSRTGLPPILQTLLSTLSTILLPTLPQHTHTLLFPLSPTRARQAILNLYQPGEGISTHVDLLGRFGDGVVGVSFGSGCVMRFGRVLGDEDKGKADRNGESWDLYLPERSVVVLSEDARYGWTHGIKGRSEDYVVSDEDGVDEDRGGRWIARGVRLSITFRWLLPGAEVVGLDNTDTDEGHSEIALEEV